jgi:hypothetical protein
MAFCRHGRNRTHHRIGLSYNLLVDVRHRRLIDVANLTVNGAPVGSYGGHIKVLAGNSRYHAMLLDLQIKLFPFTVY